MPYLAADNREQWLAIRREIATYLHNRSDDAYCRFWKRLVDLVLSSVSLIVLVPFLVAIGLIVRISSQGSALYWQDRVGLGGKLFRIAKFRTMVTDAERSGPDITSSGDPRITWLGAKLRKLKIDELPQLWNVLVGQMSLVGPRPELPRYVADYDRSQLRVLSVRPGITDLASIRYRNEEKVLAESGDPEGFYRSVVLPHKLSLNLEYIQRMSFALDVKLIFETLKSLCSGM